MIIKNPKTGKYEIIKSPAEFYESPKNKVYSGPIQPGTSEEVFRKTGKSVPSFQGPVRPGTDKAYFRATGISVSPAQANVLRQQQSQANKQALIAKEAVRIEQKKINLLKAKLIRQGASERSQILKDTDTGNAIKITTIQKRRGGERVYKWEDLVTGKTKISRYETLKGGGRSIMTGQLIYGKESAASLASKVKITSSSVTGKLLVTFPNGQQVNISSKGKVSVGSNLAGNRYLFKDGVIIAIDGKTTYAREEYIPMPRVDSVVKPSGFWGLPSVLNRVREQYSQKVMTGRASQKEQATLLAYAWLAGVVNVVYGFLSLPKTFMFYKNNPSALKDIPSEIARAGENFGYILQTNTGEGIAYLGGSYFGIRGSNLAFKQISRVSGEALGRLNSNFAGSLKKLGPVKMK